MEKKIQSVYFHDVKTEYFERIIKWYAKKHYRFISLGELRSILTEKHRIHEKLCFVSLDDGWQCNLQLIPVIERYNVPICIFVSTEPLVSGNFWWEYIERERSEKEMQEFKKLPYEQFYAELGEAKKKIKGLTRSALTVDELKSFSAHPLVTIQPHTVNHPILTNVPDDVLDHELSESKRILEEMCGTEMYAFTYPNGSLTKREVEVASKYFTLAFTVESRHISLNDQLLLLPRVGMECHFWSDVLRIWGIWPYLKRIKDTIIKA